MNRSLLSLLILAVSASIASAQVPAGPEFLVNTFTTGFQGQPSVASVASGDFVIAWDSHGQDGSSTGVFAQRFDASGRRLGGEFRVNTYTPLFQHSRALASNTRGRLVATWLSQQDGDSLGITGQRFDAAGRRLGGEFQVNTYTTASQFSAQVAMDAAGNFVVVWDSIEQDGSVRGVFGQRFDMNGARRGAEFRVNTFTYSLQGFASVAASPGGDFVVVWQSHGQDGSFFGVFGQRYDAGGAPRGAEFRVNTYTLFDQFFAAVALDPAGNFVVTWDDFDYSGFGVFGQRFDASGARLGADFVVNTYTYSFQGGSRIATDALGNFVVAWGSAPQDGGEFGVFARRFHASGAPRGAEFRVNTFTTANQGIQDIASDEVGNFVIAWQGYQQEGSDAGVFAQRFGGLLPAALEVDTGAGGNRVWEPGESVDLRPRWRNVNGAAQTFAASLSALTGPPGAAYGITDAAGNYGTVANDTSAACADCYGVSVTTSNARPLHWDASVVEAVTPDVLGQQKRWRLHIGASFSDVPAASPFYRSIEALLHHSITGGCQGSLYCPGQSTSREQMAVFVLVAKEGLGYQPPRCATPVFSDVPADSPFCAWIEELARRGVVAGCDQGRYCPGDPVSREQVAVFVLRTLDPALDPPACVPPNRFLDVPETSAFCRWIEELANRGVVEGCGGGNYCPAAAVTREQMAVFVTGTFSLALYGP